MANGLKFIAGPFSARSGDACLVVRTNVDRYLFNIQDGQFGGRIYGCFGDFVFRPGLCLMCSDEFELKVVRERIEWDYGAVANQFSSNPSELRRISKDNGYAKELLRVCFLLSNCYLCLNGNKVTTINYFGTVPPTLEEYLV